MATNVTVTESHVNDRQYAGGDNYYSFTSVVNEGDVSAGVEWLGDTPNAVGTYAGESSIKANEELLFDGSALYPDASGNVALGKATETFTEIHVANLYATTGIFYDYVYIADLNTAIATDVSNNMTFTDAVTGTKTLAELVAENSDVWEEDSAGNISPINAGSDILLAVDIERLKFGDGDTYIYEPTDDKLSFYTEGVERFRIESNVTRIMSMLHFVPSTSKVRDLGTLSLWWDDLFIDRVYIDNSNTYIDVSGTEMAFTDAINGTVTLSEMTSPWSKSSTNISPATPGDDILLAQGSERIVFGDADTYIYEAADDDLYFISGGTTMFGITTLSVFVENKLLPNTTKTHDLGSTSLWWDNTYVDRLYVDNVNTYLDVDGAEMTFTDAVSGTQKLSDLVGSGASSPLTTKGDVWGFSTVDARIPIGNDGEALVADSGEALGVKWGIWGNVVYDVTLTDNTTTNITVGDTTNNRAITVKYSLVRDTDYRSGTIDILNSGGVITDDGGSYFGDTCGLTISTDASGGNIRLNCLLTSTGDNATFEYVLIYPDYSTSTAPASYTHPNHSGHVTSVGDGAQTLVVAAITGQTALTSGLVSTDELLVNDVSAGTLKRMDISVIEAYMQANLTFGGSSLWTDNGTSLSPASGGHDLLLAVATERIIFGDGDSYIYENADDVFQFVLNSTLLFQISEPAGTVTVGANFIPTTTKAHDIGSTTLFFDNAYVDRLYVDNTNTYIDIATGDMTFTDVNSGTVSLATLVAGGSSPWTKSGTDISPTTSGDDILLATSTEALKFGAGTSYIYESSSNYITISSDGSAKMTVRPDGVQIQTLLFPNQNKARDLGTSSLFWDDCYVDRLYIDSTSVYIDVSGTEMELTDSTGSYTLSDLNLSGGGGDVSASGTLTDNVVMVGAGGTTISVPDSTVSFGGYQINTVGTITSSGSVVASGFHAGALNRVSITSTALPAMLFAVSSVTKLALNGTTLTPYVDVVPYSNKNFDLGSNTIFWANAWIDKVSFGSVDNYITEVGSDMSFTDDTAGTATLTELFTGGTVNYTTISTHTPTKYYKHINVYYSGGSTGTINVDLDAYEFASGDSTVTVSYYVSAPPGVTVNIRDSSNSVLFTVSNGGSIIQASKMLIWDNAASTWRVLI